MEKFTYKLAGKIKGAGCFWNVSLGDRFGQVFRNTDPSAPNSKRWALAEFVRTNDEPVSEDNPREMVANYFPSRRAAFHFFKTGEKFEITPVYAHGARGAKRRIR